MTYQCNSKMYKREWLEEDLQRVITMDRWYVLDGRHRKHPLHGLYTGLKELGPDLEKRDKLETRMNKAYDRLRSH